MREYWEEAVGERENLKEREIQKTKSRICRIGDRQKVRGFVSSIHVSLFLLFPFLKVLVLYVGVD